MAGTVRTQRTDAIGRHAGEAWAAVVPAARIARARAHYRQETKSFGRRATVGCLAWLVFGWLFVLFRLLPYMVAFMAVTAVAIYASAVTVVWLGSLGADGIRALWRRP